LCPIRGKTWSASSRLQFERTVIRDNTATSFQNLTLQIEPVRWRATLAGRTATVHQHLDRTLSLSYGPHSLGCYDERGGPIFNSKPAIGKAVEKARGRKVEKQTFPPRLENPAKCAGSRDSQFPTASAAAGD
jgi:hypothetical protein